MAVKRIIAIVFFIALGLGVTFSAFLTHLNIQNNKQQVYCEIIAYKSTIPKELNRTYVRDSGGGYSRYNPNLNAHVKEFYILSNGASRSISESNWISQNRLCKLDFSLVFRELCIGFLVYPFFFFFLLTPIAVLLCGAVRQVLEFLKLEHKD